MSTGYRIRVIEDFTAPEFVSAWQLICEQTHQPFTWFQTPQWVQSWWQTYGNGKVALFAGVYWRGQLIAVAPWCLSADCVHSIGDPLNDVNCIPTRPPHDSREVVRALVQQLPELLAGRSLSVQSLSLQCWTAPVTDCPLSNVVEQPPMPSPALRLPESFEAYLQGLPPDSRKRLLQSERRLARNCGPVTLEVSNDSSRILELGQRMLELREQTLEPRGLITTCEPTSRRAAFQDFFARLAGYPLRYQPVYLGALAVHGDVLAVGLYFRWNSVLMKYMQGWSLQHRQWSPGSMLDLHMIRRAISWQMRVFDLGRGSEAYKARLGAGSRYLYNYAVGPMWQAPLPAAAPACPRACDPR